MRFIHLIVLTCSACGHWLTEKQAPRCPWCKAKTDTIRAEKLFAWNLKDSGEKRL